MQDPYLSKFQELQELGLAEIRIFDGVGVEKFAEHAFEFADNLIRANSNNRCYCVRVECAEHGANSAIYEG
jgi:6-pyruvoyltetrahydropterin/6-carboxytetrahydropterin synthase